MDFASLEPFLSIIRKRQRSAHSWLVDVSDLGPDADLDIKNPTTTLDTILPAVESIRLLEQLLDEQETRLHTLRDDVSSILATVGDVPFVPLGSVTVESDERIGDEYTSDVRLVGVTNVAGITVPKTPIGKEPRKYKCVRKGFLVYNPMRINVGSVGVATSDEHLGITSPDYVVFSCNERVLPEYVFHFLRSEAGQSEIAKKTRGSVRFRLYYDRLASLMIPLPDLSIQQELVRVCRNNLEVIGAFRESSSAATQCLSAILRDVFLRPSEKKPDMKTATNGKPE